jgi:putative membrane protein
MHAGKNYRLSEFLYWTRRDIALLLVAALLPVFLFHQLQWRWLAVPWVPVALVGTAAAFIAGFRNTQTYNRLWEARQIWGAIVNTSRSWGMLVRDMVQGDPADVRTLVYRHIAWLTALRFQLREARKWEGQERKDNIEYRRLFPVDEFESTLAERLQPVLSDADFGYVMAKKNRATHLISLQSRHLRALLEAGRINHLNYVELEKLLVDLYDHQGKCERIKNFPYPRQFATINLFFIRIFVFLVPFGMLNEFQKLGENYIWLAIPFSLLVTWVFNSMEKIGEATENPFEGGANDVPITALSRTIEIDLREMLDETELPPALVPVNDILM